MASGRLIIYNGRTGGIGRHIATRRLSTQARSVESRLGDRPGLAGELKAFGTPEGVTFIHLAARVSVPECEADPDSAYETNVRLAVATVTQVLDWAERSGSPAQVVFVSTGHVYAANGLGHRLPEDADLGPRSVYARTKLDAETAISDLAASRDIPLVIGRVFGLIGPAQPDNYVLPGLIQRARKGRLRDIPGLDYTRDYLDTRDVADALLRLVEIQADRTVVNVCSGIPVTIRELLNAVLRDFDPGGAEKAIADATSAIGRPDDVTWLVGDPARYISLTGVAAQRIPLSRTVADTIRSRPSASGPCVRAST